MALESIHRLLVDKSPSPREGGAPPRFEERIKRAVWDSSGLLRRIGGTHTGTYSDPSPHQRRHSLHR